MKTLNRNLSGLLIVIIAAVLSNNCYSQSKTEKQKEGKTTENNIEKTDNANMDKELIAALDTIRQDDQKYRLQVSEVQKKYGMNSEEMKALWNVINEKDSVNLIIVEKILDERGWLGADVIGKRGNETLFLVIQHSDQKTQGKYLPMMREAVKNGKAEASSLALLEDRVALRQGKKQIYGSQVGVNPISGENYLLPLEDPDNVDKRRKEVGLPPLAGYLKWFNIEWDVKKYKKEIEKFEGKK